MTTYSVLHASSVDISSSVQTKKKQLVHASFVLLLLAKVANECFKCAKKVIRVYENTHAPGIYLETRWYFFLRPPLDTIPVKEGFIPSVVVLLPVFRFTVFPGLVLSPPYRVPLKLCAETGPSKSIDTCFG